MTYRIISILLSVLFFGTLNAENKIGENFTQGGYELVWADEFDKDGVPNPENWSFEEGFQRNKEVQWYQKGNAVCKDGKLYIQAREEIKRNPQYVKGSTAWNEKEKFIEYTSSSISTKGKHSWTMGRFVMKAKLAHGEGMWPAFWTVGDKGEWPSNGEIDIMEYYDKSILANVASGTKNRWQARWSSKKTKVKDISQDKEWLDQFHIWRMDWDEKSIRLYLNDQLLNETPLSKTFNSDLKYGPKNPFHHPQFIILNLALGGDNGGDVTKANLDCAFVIDYVRVYQREKDKQFKPEDDYVAPKPYVGKKVGIRHFSEYPKAVNKKCGWESGSDSYSYAWKPPGSGKPSAKMIGDFDDKTEGQLSYKFVLNHGWSRWEVVMDPKYGKGVADLTKYSKMAFSMKSKDASSWDSFHVVISSAGKSYKVELADIGFKADGKWHKCTIDLNKLQEAGVDISQIKTLFAIGWGGGIRNGQFFKLDDLHVE